MTKRYLACLLILLIATSNGYTGSVIIPPTSQNTSVRYIGEPTTLDHIITKEFSAGWGVGGIITDGGTNLVNVATGHGMIRSSNSPDATLYHVTWTAATGISVPINTTRYIVLYYNSGVPVIQSLTSVPNNNEYIYLGEVHNLAGVMDIHNDPRSISDIMNRIEQWNENLIGTRVASGEIATQPSSPTRRLNVTAGNVWDRFFRNINTSAFSSMSSVGDTFTNYYYNSGTSTWTREFTQSRWENTKWNNTSTGALVDMTTSYFSNRWVVRGVNGNIAILYGQAEYSSEASALAEGSPASRPEELNEHGYYIAQITFQKGANSGTITSIKPTISGGASSSAAVSVHNDLSGLNNGDYKHLTNLEYTGTGFGVFARYSTPTFKAPVIGSAIGTSLSLSGLTANRATYTDGSKNLSSSSTTNIELGYVNGVTSSIQTQLDTKITKAFHVYSTNQTLGVGNYLIACHAKTNTILKLPAGNGIIGKEYKIKKIDSTTNKCFLNATTGQTLDSFSSYSGLDTTMESVSIGARGSLGWFIFGSY